MTKYEITLIQPDRDVDLPEAQSQTYQLLQSLQDGSYSIQSLVERSNLRSPLPFWSRVRHLQEKGLLRLKTTEAAAPA